MDEEKPDAVEDENGYSSGELKIVEDENIIDKKTPNKRRKKINRKTESSDEEIDTLPKTCVEVEEKLASTAAKNRLTAANVKNILKRVVSNEHVLALVKIKEEEMEEEEQIPSPKITRAKAKEMKKLKPQVSWPLPITPVKTPPIKVTSPEVSKLIAQDLPDEESDEEYQPNLDETSEDERDTISSMSDVDSQPRTPATPGMQDFVETTPTKWTEDGLFKIPQSAPLSAMKEEPTIALRTRSKLPLNDTSIEAIEESFVPPDDDFDEEQIDNVWTDFLKEFSNPKTPTEPVNEDDEEMDPEYNAEHEKVDEEEPWYDDDDIEVTKNEFHTLLTELYESMDQEFIAEFQTDSGIVEPSAPNINLIPTILQESHHNIKTDSPIKILDISKSQPLHVNTALEINGSQIGNVTKKLSFDAPPVIPLESHIKMEEVIIPNEFKNEVQDAEMDSCDEFEHITDEDLQFKKRERQDGKTINGLTTLNNKPPDWIYKEGDGQLSPEQREILDQQMRQHIQIATQNFLQLYGHPKLWALAPAQKELLTSLLFLSDDKPESAFRPCNLKPSVEMCEEWQKMLDLDTEENRDLIAFVNKECETSLQFLEESRIHRRYTMRFPNKLVDFMFGSTGVFIYPQLLPDSPYRVDSMHRVQFLESEDRLTAIGLEQFVQYIMANPALFPSSKIDRSTQTKRRLMELISKYLVVGWTPRKLARRVAEIRAGRLVIKSNGVKHYFETGKAPETEHVILPYNTNKTLIKQDCKLLPDTWIKLHRKNLPLFQLRLKRGADAFENDGDKEEQIAPAVEGIVACHSYPLPIVEKTEKNTFNTDTQFGQILQHLQNNIVVLQRCENGGGSKSEHSVFLRVFDARGRQYLHAINPLASISTADNCQTVQSTPGPIVTSQESTTNVAKPNFKTFGDKVITNSANKRLPVKKRRRRWRKSSSSESSNRESSDDEPLSSIQRRQNNNSVLLARRKLVRSNIENKVESPCNCKDNTSDIEVLPKGQTLLTKYFKKANKNSNVLDENGGVSKDNNVSDSALNVDVSLSKQPNQETAQSNCVDSTSVTDPDISLWKVSNLHIYNREGFTLNTILSKLNCLLYVNWKKRALNCNRPSKLKSKIAKSAKANLLKRIYEVDTTMLPSMPFLSTPSKSSFDDECFEPDVTPISEISKTSNADSIVGEKDGLDTSKKPEDKTTPLGQSKVQNAPRLSASTGTSTSSKVGVKVSKAQKELEASKAMFATSDPFTDDLKDTTYATAFFEKVQERLSAKTDSELGERDDFFEFQNILSTFDPEKENPCDLYFKFEKLFGPDNDDLTEEFLTFLTAGQAVQIGRFMDHFLLTSMTDFIERLQIYFARRPSQLRKILWSLNQIVDGMDSSQDDVSMEKIKATILPHLKGNHYLLNWFMRLFPTEKLEDNLTSGGYEVLDVEKLTKDMCCEDSSRVDSLEYEVVSVPSVEDAYGTEACVCHCHATTDEVYASRSKHCLPCGMRYVQGRLYIPHGKALRPGRINWSNEDEAKSQAMRLGLLHSNRSSAVGSVGGVVGGGGVAVGGGITSSGVGVGGGGVGGRKRAMSHEPGVRESDDERVSPKRAVKCLRTPTSKTKFSKLSLVKKNSESEDSSRPSCSKSIMRLEQNGDGPTTSSKGSMDSNDRLAETLPSDDTSQGSIGRGGVDATADGCRDEDMISSQSYIDPWNNDIIDIHEPSLVKMEVEDVRDEGEETTSQEDEPNPEDRTIKVEEDEQIWTRDEDKAILLVLQCESDMECTFEKIKRLLPHRSLDEIRERFQSVMQLLQQMASDR